MNRQRIGVLTGGGDCAGLSPAIKWVVKTALDERLQWERGVRYEVIGIHDGWKGLVRADPDNLAADGYLEPLDEKTVRTWDRYGGTFLGTSRTNPYDPNNDRSEVVLNNIKRLGLKAVIAIGGEDTLGVAYKLSRDGVNVVGIPKTIDKDLPKTDYTLGFDTALNVIVEEVDRLRTTAGSHKRTFVVETMGRQVCELVLEGRKSGARYDIILVAEGARPLGGVELVKENGLDSFGHKALGGIGEFLANQISNNTGLECRSVVLSHLQRGGAPGAYDRRMGRYFGIAAVDLVATENFGKMVSYKNGQITAVPLSAVIGKPTQVDITTQYDVERYNGRRTILSNMKPRAEAGMLATA